MKYKVTVLGNTNHKVFVEAMSETEASDIAARWVHARLSREQTRDGVFAHEAEVELIAAVDVESLGHRLSNSCPKEDGLTSQQRPHDGSSLSASCGSARSGRSSLPFRRDAFKTESRRILTNTTAPSAICRQ
jgi:hypothetical protein